MVTQWGFSKNKLAAVAWEQDGPWYGPQAASPDTEVQIDNEVKLLVAEAYARCKKLLFENREMVDEMTEMMIETVRSPPARLLTVLEPPQYPLFPDLTLPLTLVPPPLAGDYRLP